MKCIYNNSVVCTACIKCNGILVKMIKISHHMSYINDKLGAAWQNQQNDLCAQRRLRSAWASAQSDQSLCCPHEETLGPQLPIGRTAKTDQTGQMPRRIWVLVGAHVILLVLPYGSSNVLIQFAMIEELSHVTRKPVFGVCDQIRLKQVCSASETS